MRPKSTARAKVGGRRACPAPARQTTGMPRISRSRRAAARAAGRHVPGAQRPAPASRPCALQLAREQRHEGGREGAFGEQAAEEVGKLERNEEGVRHAARTEHRRQHDVADEADDTAEQREAADGGDGAAETHGRRPESGSRASEEPASLRAWSASTSDCHKPVMVRWHSLSRWRPAT